MHGQISALDQRTTYRPDIDGLRAVAVLSVLAYHYGAPFPGGFTGVDVFFVISGFLITSKLRDDIVAGTFSILGFYDRRVRRILPALLVMLAVTLLAGRFLLMPGDYKALATSTATAAFGASNFFFLWNTGYFDQATNLLPLLHTWSLAVEEQFYVVWPLLLFFIGTGRRRAVLLIATIIIGFVASLFWLDNDPKGAFFMAAPRAWELAIGALLVFLPPLPRALGEVATALGLALISTGFVVVTDASFPGFAALYPCIGAALVIWPRRARTATGAWLGLLSPIGLISYSLYLWHWPVWVMFRIYINGGQPSIRETAALALISVALAVMSYRFVEQPFRKKRWRPAQSVGAGLTACTVLFGAAMFVHIKEGLPERVSPEAFAMRSLDVMWNWPCPATVELSGQRLCSFGAPWVSAKHKAMLWGDSHAEHFAPLLDQAGRETDTAFVLFMGCSPIHGRLTGMIRDMPPIGGHKYFDWCSDRASAAFSILDAHPEISTAALATPWTAIQPLTHTRDGTPASAAMIEDAIKTVDRRIGQSRAVLLLGDVPHRPYGVPVLCASQQQQILRRCGEAKGISQDVYRESIGKTYSMLKRVTETSSGIFATFPGQSLCKADNCSLYVNGEFLYRDIDHIRRNLSPETDRKLADDFGITGVLRLIGSENDPHFEQ